MELRWTEDAANDLERIADYLFEKTPQHAPDLVRSIYEAPRALLTFPHRGRPGKKAGPRGISTFSVTLHPDLSHYRQRHPSGSHTARRSKLVLGKRRFLQACDLLIQKH
jgi:plasmid stabilization system protein ParE